MTDVDDARARGEAVSRRRVLHGIAWTTPAVLIATSSPPAAASGGEGISSAQGALALAGTFTALNESAFTFDTMVAYAGAARSAGAGVSPVTSVTLDLALPSGRVTGEAPSIVSGSAWTYTGAATAGGETSFTFAWQGDNLTDATPSTSPLTVTIPKTASLDAAAVTFTARGTSAGLPVPPSVVVDTRAVLTANAPTFAHGGAIRHQEWFQSNPKVDAWVFNAALVWSGPWSPVGPAINHIAVEFRIPAGESDGTLLPSWDGIGAGWTADGVPAVVDGFWRVRYRYNGAISKGSERTDELRFALKAPVATATAVQYTLTGQSAGVALTAAGVVSR
ncbi:hypothetical protein [Demequina mangrovi]|uniref:Uncharacterized protein n=1 Tax=Demequina mangrovi TaxID=1043493 RepID=A0A1H6YTB9_9MICO|nr:hypothetical protein [Demequina mangrovi]SEJ39965.1 hypothetical protein SAMN05421637_1715 [Demequina mangrovi]